MIKRLWSAIHPPSPLHSKEYKPLRRAQNKIACINRFSWSRLRLQLFVCFRLFVSNAVWYCCIFKLKLSNQEIRHTRVPAKTPFVCVTCQAQEQLHDRALSGYKKKCLHENGLGNNCSLRTLTVPATFFFIGHTPPISVWYKVIFNVLT